ncbi:hypothetical protein PVAP13_9KG374800 [Panicum virgatum]|uniref:Rx N-terminal domain-containing protein n=1 Tax=Panicum virgatum TaxID=38727 RepID=A0A8T0NPE8_PANVG|nr:hypothetical protein PVAP13_9KG374800 [Panicum virgatum]
MAEMVSSAVAEEIVTQIVSSVLDKQRQEWRPSEQERLERLEMAHIKLEAALETSDRWRISDASLLRWRRKLKRAARDCDDALRRCKRERRAVEDEETRRAARAVSSFPARLAHAARSLLSSGSGILGGGSGGSDDDWSGPAVRRFECYAVHEVRGARRRAAAARVLGPAHRAPARRRRAPVPAGPGQPVPPLLRPSHSPRRPRGGGEVHLHLRGRRRAGEEPVHRLDAPALGEHGRRRDHGQVPAAAGHAALPAHGRGRGQGAREPPDAGLLLGALRRRHATHKEHWDSIHSDMSQWFRPDPLCCSSHHQHRAEPPCDGDTGGATAMGAPEVSLESVIEVYWQCQIPLTEYSTQRRAIAEGRAACSKDAPHLKLGLLFTPHGSLSLGGVTPTRVESSALEVIDGEEQRGAHYTNLSLRQLDETMLPKALECLYLRAEATAYQMLWKSRHGAAYLQVKKTIPGRDGSGRRSLMQLRHRLHHQDPKLERWTHVLTSFLKLWVARAPERLRCSMVELLQRANEKQLAVLLLQ